MSGDWKCLSPVYDKVVPILANLVEDKRIFDILVARNLLTLEKNEKFISQLENKSPAEDVARNLLSCLRRKGPGSYRNFCDIVNDLPDGSDLYHVLIPSENPAENKLKSIEEHDADLSETRKIFLHDESRRKFLRHDFDGWEKLKNECRFFDRRNEFLLLAGKASKEFLTYYEVLRIIRWKAVMCVDPESDRHGLYKALRSRTSAVQRTQALIEMKLPSEIRQLKTTDLGGYVNWNRTPWFFCSGRSSDSEENRPPKDFETWRGTTLYANFDFVTLLAENVDRNKTLVVVVFPFEHKENAYLCELIKFLNNKLSQSSVKFVAVNTEIECTCLANAGTACPFDLTKNFPNFALVKCYSIPAKIFSIGLNSCLPDKECTKYRMPTAKEDVKVSLSENEDLYCIISENLLLLHEKCAEEELYGKDSDDRKSAIDNEQRVFLSGGQISFINLQYNHDARREIIDKLRPKIHNLLVRQRDKGTSTVVELTHKSGAGGTTIARRILWELRDAFPCAIAKQTMAVQQLYDRDRALRLLAENIAKLEDACFTPPLVLLDGEESIFRSPNVSRQLCDCLAIMGKQAVILHCLRGGSTFSLHASGESMHVDCQLSDADKIEFEQKFKPHIKDYPSNRRKLKHSGGERNRAFHYPLAAFLDNYKGKLKSIVHSDLYECKGEEVKIIRFVAVVEKFAGRSTYSGLVYEMFLKKNGERTPLYADIYDSFSDSAKNLLVQRRNVDTTWTYDLHHPSVADIVCEKLLSVDKRGRHLTLLKDCVEKDILSRLKKDELEKAWVSLFEDLFLHNISSRGQHFSDLILALETQHGAEATAKLLAKAAKLFCKQRFFTHLARYYCYKSVGDFQKRANEAVEEARKVAKLPIDKRYVCDVQGLVYRTSLQRAVNDRKVKSIDQLIKLAKDALEAYDEAAVLSPNWPNPLIGKVKVHIECLKWIRTSKRYQEFSELMVYLLGDGPQSFFKKCLSQSFQLLDHVDKIVSTVSLADAAHTEQLIKECRTELVSAEVSGSFKGNPQLPGEELRSLSQRCETFIKNRRLAYASQKEMRRLQLQFFLNYCQSRKLVKLSAEDNQYLFPIIRAIVEEDKDYSEANNYFLLASRLDHDSFTPSIDHSIEIAMQWKGCGIASDPYIWFHLYIFYFIKVITTKDYLEHGLHYRDAVQNSNSYSEHFINRYVPHYYLRKFSGSNPTLRYLMDRHEMLQNHTIPRVEDSEEVEEFWRKSREFLHTLEGRIKINKTDRGKLKADIELSFGGGKILVFVGKCKDTWEHRNGELVTFVLSFRLSGPRAHGIVFKLDQ